MLTKALSMHSLCPIGGSLDSSQGSLQGADEMGLGDATVAFGIPHGKSENVRKIATGPALQNGVLEHAEIALDRVGRVLIIPC